MYPFLHEYVGEVISFLVFPVFSVLSIVSEFQFFFYYSLVYCYIQDLMTLQTLVIIIK